MCRWRVARLAFEHARTLVTLAFRSVSNIRLFAGTQTGKFRMEDRMPDEYYHGTAPGWICFARGGRWERSLGVTWRVLNS